jgi:dihydrofolate synthase/folylpolyglutamate synthase
MTVMGLTTPERRYDLVRLGLRGEHQVHNAVVAVRLLETVNARGLAVGEDAIRVGLEAVRWPARLDLRVLKDGRRVLIDGAHNPAGAAALSRYLSREWPGGLPIVFGSMRDKDLAAMLAPLASVARPLLLTRAPGERSASTSELAAAARTAGIRSPVLEPDMHQALERAWSMGQTIAVAGSLYLAGGVLEWIERD